MSIAPQNILLPEDLLADMLVETQVWRALVAAPTDTWAEIKATLAAGTVSAGTAAAAVKQVFWLDEFTPAPDMPFCVIRQIEPEIARRQGRLILQGSLNVELFLRVPTGMESTPGAAVLDMRTKLFALKTELISLAPQGGRLDITQVTQEAGGINNPEVDGGGNSDRYLIGDLDVGYESGAC